MFQTKCPACNEDGTLYVIGGVFMTVGMPLCQDGFAFDDAQQVSTEDETVRCDKCERLFNLGDLHRNDPSEPDKRLRIKGD